ncbi:MAG TPA: 3D domain-containing protein [Pyrinomonadaceae bacterium]|nr:3D domain-containing protein [Pyrinomonadaceae bacterium]
MSRSLLGGGAATAVALLSASLIFSAETSVAEPLAFAAVATTSNQPSAATDAATPEAEEPAAKADSKGVEDTETESSLAKSTGRGERPESDSAEAGRAQSFVATAYSLRGRTASGRQVARGLIAADRRVLPLGSRVRLDAGSYSGEYVVADTGGLVRGRKIDIWMPSSGEAMRFGRRTVKLTVLSRPAARKAATPARKRR